MVQSQPTDSVISMASAGSYQARLSAMATPRNGLELPRLLPFDRWVNIGKQLSAASSSSAWCLGDWLAYGMEAFTGRYRSAVDETSLDYQTLRNYVWVAKRFPLARRREGLSFGHHAEVAALADPEQDFWLRKAEELGWSVKWLRQEVRSSLRERGDGVTEGDEQGLGLVRLNIRIEPDQLETYQTAAAKAGLKIAEWAVKALTSAAHDTLRIAS